MHGDAAAGSVMVFCTGRLLECDPASRSVRELCAVPGEVHTAALTPDGRLYFAEGTRLHVLEEFPDPCP